MFDVPLDAQPSDRDKIAAYIIDIETDHKVGPDGTLIPVDKITYGKMGTLNYQNIVEVKRLQRDNPRLWEHFRPTYEKWKNTETIVREGMPLDAWPAITKGQIKECKAIGIFVVEDLADAHDGIRTRLGVGAAELIAKARAWVANKDSTATASKVADLEKRLDDAMKANEDMRALIDQLMAEQGKRPRKLTLKTADADA
ncbi:MAG: hypothetical protein AB7O43_17325 [Hyphomicrobiaceae bacterium]